MNLNQEEYKIRKAKPKDAKDLTDLGFALWPENTWEEIFEEISLFLAEDQYFYLVAEKDEKLIGFAEISLRHDYVEGTSSSPVGYLEGIYVDEKFRRKHIAQELVKKAEEWALEREQKNSQVTAMQTIN